MSHLVDVTLVEDRTDESRCDAGFLRLRRLILTNRYEDGHVSEPYACDIVSRLHVDAVAVVLHDRDAAGTPRVAVRAGVRPPVVLRRDKAIPHGERRWMEIEEIVAGVLEGGDTAPGGVEERAAAECMEEAGFDIDPGEVAALGGGLFPTPGVTDEYVHFRHVIADLDAPGTPTGDGSVMEERTRLVLLPLREAIRRCRSGEIPDMKTEVALLRLCDAIGYLPAFDRFLDDMPKVWQRRARGLPPLI